MWPLQPSLYPTLQLATHHCWVLVVQRCMGLTFITLGRRSLNQRHCKVTWWRNWQGIWTGKSLYNLIRSNWSPTYGLAFDTITDIGLAVGLIRFCFALLLASMKLWLLHHHLLPEPLVTHLLLFGYWGVPSVHLKWGTLKTPSKEVPKSDVLKGAIII